MKKFSFFEKPAGAKTVYLMAGVSFCLAAIAVGIVYSQNAHRLSENPTSSVTTHQAGRNQQGESDPRYTEPTQISTTQSASVTQTQGQTQEIASEAPVRATTAQTETTAEKQSFMLPCDGKIIREYSPDIPVYCETMEDWRTHNGVDFALSEDDEVLSVGKGKVSRVLIDSVYGYTVEVDYGTFTARYCGMKQGECVGIDQLLNKGDSIGKVDEVPCEKKSEKHLHFEIIKDGDYADPIKVLKK